MLTHMSICTHKGEVGLFVPIKLIHQIYAILYLSPYPLHSPLWAHLHITILIFYPVDTNTPRQLSSINGTGAGMLCCSSTSPLPVGSKFCPLPLCLLKPKSLDYLDQQTSRWSSQQAKQYSPHPLWFSNSFMLLAMGRFLFPCSSAMHEKKYIYIFYSKFPDVLQCSLQTI
jgi:hypothetical protein